MSDSATDKEALLGRLTRVSETGAIGEVYGYVGLHIPSMTAFAADLRALMELVRGAVIQDSWITGSDLSPASRTPGPGEAGKWTRGPWEVRFRFGRQTTVSGRQRYPICDTGTAPLGEANHRREEANARLIAAAPELYEALARVMSAHGEQLHDAFDAAHRALQKANPADTAQGDRLADERPARDTPIPLPHREGGR